MNKLQSSHHYISQFYLRNFASIKKAKNSKIFSYEKGKSGHELLIKDIASEKGFYNVQHAKTKQETDMVEEAFAKVESRIAPIIKKIIDTESIVLSIADRTELDYFFALMYVRTADFRLLQKELDKEEKIHFLKSITTDRKRFKNSLEKTGIKLESDEEMEKMRVSIINFDKYYKLESKGGESGLIKLTLKFASDFYPCFRIKHLILAKTNCKNVFITSDNPIVLLPQDRVYGKGLLNSTILIPLTPYKCLIYHMDKYKDVIKVNEKQIGKINQCIMTSARRFIYSNINSKSISRKYNSIEGGRKITTKSFFTPNSSLFITSYEAGPYLAGDIFKFFSTKNKN